MDTKTAGRMGALVTNKKLTKEIRSKAAKKAWRNRRKKALKIVESATAKDSFI